MEKRIHCLVPILFLVLAINAQVTERVRHIEWDSLTKGGRFMDLFLPIPPMGQLTANVWGADNVIPRYVDNGIEDDEWSYWGGNALLGKDRKHHLFVCRWREDSEKGHNEWPNSLVVHAVSNNSFGPYQVRETVGPGHNPEIFQLHDGKYVVYVIDGRYLSENLDGPWTYDTFEFNPRDRPIIEGLSNLSFAQRENGTYIMVCRGGGIWFSKDGLSTYNQVTDKSVYPPVKGHFEDPVIWRTNIQYHMIVNDWLGRIAYYLRSKDGIHWKIDPGEAYLPGITKYTDGTNEDWFKYERIKVVQDALGRATQAHFAVIDVLKKKDKGNDAHSSKHITIPLTVGRQIALLNTDKIDENTDVIRIKIAAEKGFDPHTDINLDALRFGAPEEVNFGRGCKVEKTEKDGPDLIVTFYGKGNGITKVNFTGKLLGKTNQGKLLFGYARLPWVDYLEPALSPRKPEIVKEKNNTFLRTEVQNFGQVASQETIIKITKLNGNDTTEIAQGKIPKLTPFQKTEIKLPISVQLKKGMDYMIQVILYPKKQNPIISNEKIQYN